jgi:hypothetical protein
LHYATEEEVFSEIMTRHSTRIFRLASNLLHNDADAEEITDYFEFARTAHGCEAIAYA